MITIAHILQGKPGETPAETTDGTAVVESTGSTIVYCLTRSTTENVATVLQGHGVECAAYHAGLGTSQRQSIHEKFVRDQLQVIQTIITCSHSHMLLLLRR